MTSPTALTVLRAVAGGAGSLAPVHAALGTVLDTIEPGLAVARVPRLPPHRLRGPGVVPVLGDLVLSAAITSSLAAGLRISTLTLHTAMLGPLPPPGAALVARAELVGPGVRWRVGQRMRRRMGWRVRRPVPRRPRRRVG